MAFLFSAAAYPCEALTTSGTDMLLHNAALPPPAEAPRPDSFRLSDPA